MCVFDCEGPKFVRGLKMRPKKINKKAVQLALRQDVGPCIVILFRLGFGTFNLTQ